MKRNLEELLGRDLLSQLDPATVLVLHHFTHFSDEQLRQISSSLLLNQDSLKQVLLADAMLAAGNGNLNEGDISRLLGSSSTRDILRYAAMTLVEGVSPEEKTRLKCVIDEDLAKEIREAHIRTVIEAMEPVQVYTRGEFIKRSVVAGLTSLAVALGITTYQFLSNSHYIALGKQVAIAEERASEAFLAKSESFLVANVDLFTSKNDTYELLICQAESLDRIVLSDSLTYENERAFINRVDPYTIIKKKVTGGTVYEDFFDRDSASLKLSYLKKFAKKAKGTLSGVRSEYDAAIQRIYYAPQLGELDEATTLVDSALLNVKNNPEVFGLGGVISYVSALQYAAAEMNPTYNPVELVSVQMTQLGELAGPSILGSDVFYVLGKLELNRDSAYDLTRHILFERESKFSGDRNKARHYFQKSRGASVDPDRYARASVCIAETIDYQGGGLDLQDEAWEYHEDALGTTDNLLIRSVALLGLGDISRLQGEYELANQLYDQVVRENNGVGSHAEDAKDKKFNVGFQRFVDTIF